LNSLDAAVGLGRDFPGTSRIGIYQRFLLHLRFAMGETSRWLNFLPGVPFEWMGAIKCVNLGVAFPLRFEASDVNAWKWYFESRSSEFYSKAAAICVEHNAQKRSVSGPSQASEHSDFNVQDASRKSDQQ